MKEKKWGTGHGLPCQEGNEQNDEFTDGGPPSFNGDWSGETAVEMVSMAKDNSSYEKGSP